jgi:hypothetical protein
MASSERAGALLTLMQQALELEHPGRAIAVTESPGRPWQFDVTVGPLPPSPAWTSFAFEVTEPARSRADQRQVVILLFAAVRKMLEEYGGKRPSKVTVS